MRKSLVYPTKMVWPSILPLSALIETLHRDKAEMKKKFNLFWVCLNRSSMLFILPEINFLSCGLRHRKLTKRTDCLWSCSCLGMVSTIYCTIPHWCQCLLPSKSKELGLHQYLWRNKRKRRAWTFGRELRLAVHRCLVVLSTLDHTDQ